MTDLEDTDNRTDAEARGYLDADTTADDWDPDLDDTGMIEREERKLKERMTRKGLDGLLKAYDVETLVAAGVDPRDLPEEFRPVTSVEDIEDCGDDATTETDSDYRSQ